jgi:L-ascorbate metabolism protein UlaG (beta-lactamase superfamily)
MIFIGDAIMANTTFETDMFPTSAGDLAITFIGHASLMMTFSGKTIHIDPFSELADYASLPKADILFLTHEHGDHMDKNALLHVRTDRTITVMNENCAKELEGGIVMHNGDTQMVEGIEVEAIPAYNIVHKRPGGGVFHPKGSGNGYVLGFGDTRVYIAGDTENTPEMKSLKNIAVAFLPMNLPYTMTPEMVADAAKTFRPRILYPYHFGETDTSQIVELLKGEDIEVRLRKLA